MNWNKILRLGLLEFNVTKVNYQLCKGLNINTIETFSVRESKQLVEEM